MVNSIDIANLRFDCLASSPEQAIYRASLSNGAYYYMIESRFSKAKRFYLWLVRPGKMPFLVRKTKNLIGITSQVQAYIDRLN